MTTIAYKDGIIAYDSRATRGDVIACDSVNKRLIRNGVLFFGCGIDSDIERLADAYIQGESAVEGADAGAFVVDGKDVFRIGVDSGRIWKSRAYNTDAIGSGYVIALTAMDCGLSAFDAVKMAAKRDLYTGGKIRHCRVK